jgi:hypothetical protein
MLAKNKNFVPGAGAYDYEKSFDKITKGVNKSYK